MMDDFLVFEYHKLKSITALEKTKTKY